MNMNKTTKKIEVILVEPLKEPRCIEINNDLETMQQLVGGLIEMSMPFEDEVAIICNDEGKLKGLEPNRAIYAENGYLMDIIAGTFFIAKAPFDSEEFESLSEDMKNKYLEKYRTPEKFLMVGNTIQAVPYIQ